jgi:hypothetical protein
MDFDFCFPIRLRNHLEEKIHHFGGGTSKVAKEISFQHTVLTIHAFRSMQNIFY